MLTLPSPIKRMPLLLIVPVLRKNWVLFPASWSVCFPDGAPSWSELTVLMPSKSTV